MYVNKRLTLARENYAREIIADMIDYEVKQAFTIKPKNENRIDKSRLVQRRTVARQKHST